MSDEAALGRRWADHVGLGTSAISVTEELFDAAQDSGDEVFLRFDGSTATFEEVERSSNSLATGFERLGVTAGDPVALLMNNSIDLVLCLFALNKIGAFAVPLNTDYTGELLRNLLQDSGAGIIVADLSLSLGLGGVIPEGVDIVLREDDQDSIDGLVGLDPVGMFSGLLVPDDERERMRQSQGDIFHAVFTSGTTGRSKAVLISHGQALTFASDWVDLMRFGKDDVLYACLPMFHALTTVLGIVPCLLARAEMAIDTRFSASGFWRRVHETEATVAHVIFSIIPILLNQEPSEYDRGHRLRSVYLGQNRTSRDFQRRFGTVVVEAYGQSETGLVAGGPVGDIPSAPPDGKMPIGKINEQRFEVRIADDADNELPDGETGEILVRPKAAFTTMIGYLNRPDATSKSFRNLWYHTGDRGWRDSDGWLYFAERTDDRIRVRGTNVSASEIEDLTNRHPAVRESVVVGVPSELGDDEIKLYVVPTAEGEFDYAELVSYCFDHLPKVMVPRYIEVLTDIPKTATYKVKRGELRSGGVSGPTGLTWDVARKQYVS